MVMIIDRNEPQQLFWSPYMVTIYILQKKIHTTISYPSLSTETTSILVTQSTDILSVANEKKKQMKCLARESYDFVTRSKGWEKKEP